jgi:hypothetical protein
MNDFLEPAPAASSRDTAEIVRHFEDADGVRWRVFEQPFSDYDRRRGLSLIFASDIAVRRVRDYPADWHTLSEDALHALSWKS